jgi:hypothetical protein
MADRGRISCGRRRCWSRGARRKDVLEADHRTSGRPAAPRGFSPQSGKLSPSILP